MSFTDVNEHTKKIISNKHEKSMNKFSVTTPDRTNVALEKAFSLESSKSILSSDTKEKTSNKISFAKEIEALKKTHKTRLIRNTNSDENISTSKNGISAEKFNKSENKEIVNIPSISSEAMQMINALVHTQNHIVQELTDVFDKRLEKFDEIVMDLVRCKTENERLKQKVDNLTRDNYKYKKEMECFKSILPGVYIKKELDETRF